MSNNVDIAKVLNQKINAAKTNVMDSTLQKLADNETFVQTLAKQQLKAEGIAVLKDLVAQVDALTEAKSRLFGYGEGIDLVVQLASSWLYSKAEVKPLIEAIVPVLPKYGEDLITTAGKLPYYSETLNAIMDGEPMNVDTFRSLISAFANDLNIYIEVSQLTEEHVKAVYDRANLKADLAFKEAANTKALQQNALEL